MLTMLKQNTVKKDGLLGLLKNITGKQEEQVLPKKTLKITMRKFNAVFAVTNLTTIKF